MTFSITAHKIARYFRRELCRTLRISIALCFLILVTAPIPGTLSAKDEATSNSQTNIQAFQPGETLIYDISWSNILTAGTAIMEVKNHTLPDGKEVLQFIVTGHSIGLIDKLFKVYDAVQSVFDPKIMQSLTFNVDENYGKKKKRSALVFDHAQNTVTSKVNDDPPKKLIIPDHVQDLLSSFYYLQGGKDFGQDKTIVFEVYEGGKIWSVEVYTLGREILKTPAGEFSTIKIRTYPKYKGVFMHKGEVFIWLTDDSRKVPVLMKIKLAVGSFVFTLREVQREGEAR